MSSFLKIDNGIKLTLEHESINTFLNDLSLIVQGIATAPGSFFLIVILLSGETLPHFSVTTSGSTPTGLFLEITSFMNFLYKGIFSSASKKGKLISNFLNIAANFSKSFPFESFLATVEGNGDLITGLASFLFFSSIGLSG